MKKGVTLIFAVLILTSVLVLAAHDDPNRNGNDDSPYMQQTEDRATLRYELRERTNLTPEEVENIIRERNELRVRERINALDCPSECDCNGSATRCEFENGSRTLMIRAGNSNNTILQIKDINASTRVFLYKEGDMIYGRFRNNDTRKIILPDEARDRIQNRTRAKLRDENITLDEEGRYQIEARKRARLLGLIPVRERVRAQIDAETGEILRERNPWWGFLAADAKDNTESDNSTNETQ